MPLVAGEEVGLEVRAEKTVYILTACQKNAGKNHNINMTKTCFDNLGELKYQGMILTNYNYMHKGIMHTLHLGNAYNHLIQNVFPFPT